MSALPSKVLLNWCGVVPYAWLVVLALPGIPRILEDFSAEWWLKGPRQPSHHPGVCWRCEQKRTSAFELCCWNVALWCIRNPVIIHREERVCRTSSGIPERNIKEAWKASSASVCPSSAQGPRGQRSDLLMCLCSSVEISRVLETFLISQRLAGFLDSRCREILQMSRRKSDKYKLMLPGKGFNKAVSHLCLLKGVGGISAACSALKSSVLGRLKDRNCCAFICDVDLSAVRSQLTLNNEPREQP